jgi:hypothetical protein
MLGYPELITVQVIKIPNHRLLGLYNHGFQKENSSNNQPENCRFVPGSFMKPNGSLIMEFFKYSKLVPIFQIPDQALFFPL